MDEDLFELFMAYLPESLAAWAGFAIVFCAVVAVFWPKPEENAHPFWKGLHALVNAIGLNVRHARNMPRPLRKNAKKDPQSALIPQGKNAIQRFFQRRKK